MTEKKVAIIIVNWNGLNFLKDCLSSVFNQSYQNYDVYFVDNGSVDGSLIFVEENFPKTRIVKLNYNTGFAKGNNEGIKEAFKDELVEYIVCLNNDTIVEYDWLTGFVAQVNYEKKIEMVGSLSLLPDGRVYSIGARFDKSLNDLSIGYGDNPQNYTEVREIFSPHGVSALYTKRLLLDVGLFDEYFFAYCEEFDLGLRAQNKGYRALFTPKSRLVHLVSQSSGGMANPFKAYLNKRNSYFVAIKNFGFADLLLFPWRDFFWILKKIFYKDNADSVSILKNKIGAFGMTVVMIKVLFNVVLGAPPMFVKRFKAKKY
jgi:GT2 family glycosyltransferase